MISLADLEGRTASRLVAEGCRQPTACSVAKALVRAESEGQIGHGLRRLPSYIQQIRAGKIDPQAVASLSEAAPALALISAHSGFAFPALDLAVEDLKTRAHSQGIAAAAISASHHCGVAGHPVSDLAAANCAALLFANTPAAIAPAGGQTPRLGTNPIAFAVSLGDGIPPLVIDMSLSVVARGKILAAHQARETIPEDWAFDAEGRPTTDPAAALQGGSLAAIGGTKGAVLALMVEILAAGLTGSEMADRASSFLNAEGGPPHTGQLMIAISLEHLGGAALHSQIADFCTRLQEEDGTRLPGMRSHQAREAAKTNGLSDDLLEYL